MALSSEHLSLGYQPITPKNLKTYRLLERLLFANGCHSVRIILIIGPRKFRAEFDIDTILITPLTFENYYVCFNYL
jgi:hypothetical protein